MFPLYKKLDEFYAKYITGLDAFDYNKYLDYAGYKLTDEYAGSNVPALGIGTVVNGGRILVSAVLRGSAGWIDGINVNDEITAVNGRKLTTTDGMLNGTKPGDKLAITVTRDGLPMDLTVTLLKSPNVKYKIEALPTTDAKQLTVRKKWLKL